VSAQLEQLVGYLDREGVTEVVISVGRPIAMKQRDTFVNLTARPLTGDQLASLLRGTPIAAMVPDDNGTADAQDVAIGKRRARVQVGRRGDEIVVRLERVRAKSPSAAPPPQRIVETTRSRTPSQPGGIVQGGLSGGGSGSHLIQTPRAKSPTAPVHPEPQPPARSKTPSSPPRTKSPTGGPRTKSRTAAPRTKTSSKSPTSARTKSPSAAPPTAASTKRAGTELGTPLGPRPAPQWDIVAGPPAVSLDSEPNYSLESPVFGGGDASASVGTLELDPLTPSLELDPADARAGFDPRKESTDARPTWDVGVKFSQRSTPLPQAAQAARTAAVANAPAAAPRPALTTPVLADGPLAQLVRRAREGGATDLHVAAGRPVAIRVGNELRPLEPAPLSASGAEAMLLPLLDAPLRAQLDRLGYADLAVPLASGGRLRANITRHSQGLKGTFRLAMTAPSTLEELGLPKELAKVVGHHQGLVVIAGPSGHGKTTTLAALVDMVNATKPYHILTVEDPIEIVYERKAAVVSQREAGRHTKSFAAALKASLREDPDVIVIGELRDRETVEIALTASETGHLVLATMSTPSAAKTLDRLIDMFPPDEHPQVRASIAGALRAIVAQRLVPARDGKVAAAIELVTGVLPLAVLIRDDKLYQLPNLMQRGKAFGMIRFDESLADLVRAGRISEDTALAFATSKTELAAALRRPG
jgi:pilus retraction protein PilT